MDAIRFRERAIAREWRALSAATAGARGGCGQPVRDAHVPMFLDVVSLLGRGDVSGAARCVRELGEQLAADAVPFGTLVGQANLLVASCARTLTDTPVAADELMLLGRITVGLLGAAAGGYGASQRTVTQIPTTQPATDGTAAFHGLVGSSAALRRVIEQIQCLAPCDAPVLILGETGTGKEVAARALHDASPRSQGPFVAINCAALPRELVESELFGYRRGAFSGALRDGPGLFRAAAGGTVFLDEITEMAPDLQAKLLRVLQECTVRPIGAVAEEPVDVRIVASTNRDPRRALRSRQLRADLYYRLSVTALTLPPLRERPEDVPPLVEHYLRRLNARRLQLGLSVRELAPAAAELLVAQRWRGNVRELFNVLERAATMCRGATIEPDDLGLSMPASGGGDAPRRAVPSFKESERTLIARTLAVTGGNKQRAARQLGISRKKLYARIAQYGLILAVVICVHAPIAPSRSSRRPLRVEHRAVVIVAR